MKRVVIEIDAGDLVCGKCIYLMEIYIGENECGCFVDENMNYMCLATDLDEMPMRCTRCIDAEIRLHRGK